MGTEDEDSINYPRTLAKGVRALKNFLIYPAIALLIFFLVIFLLSLFM
jgi:type II secretory pathway component PulF